MAPRWRRVPSCPGPAHARSALSFLRRRSLSTFDILTTFDITLFFEQGSVSGPPGLNLRESGGWRLLCVCTERTRVPNKICFAWAGANKLLYLLLRILTWDVAGVRRGDDPWDFERDDCGGGRTLGPDIAATLP